jgi:hypothetical protein
MFDQHGNIEERDDYSLPAWAMDTVNIIKQREFLPDKSGAFLIFIENLTEFLDCYYSGQSPYESYREMKE